jgi:thioredoxin 1
MKELTERTLKEALKENKLVFSYYGAQWCSPCKAIHPIVEELSKENDNIFIGKVDVETNPELCDEYGIRSIPALIFYKNGEPVERLLGFHSKADLQAVIDKLSKEN